MRSVIVIGGGLAGLSAAIVLAEAGFRVRLFEKRPHLGGRATSYWLPDGGHVDNCQHVTMRCCTNLDDFYARVAAREKIRYYDRLYFAGPQGHRGEIAASPLPPPLHLAPSFTLFPALSLADKHGIARAMLSIARAGGPPPDAFGANMLDWLRARGQTPRAIARFWRVVLVSALNEELERTGARYGVDVFWKAFLATRRGFEVGIPVVPLANLYDGCRAEIERRGGEVRLRAAVREIAVADERVAGVRFDNGESAYGDFYVLAVPHDEVLKLLPPAVVERDANYSGLRHLAVSPITGIHFRLDREVMAAPFLTVLDRTIQWVFNKSRMLEAQNDGATGGQYLQIVVSASYGLVPLSRQEIIELCWRELCEVIPAAREAKLLKATVIKETAATFSPQPGCDRWRPPQVTGLKNLLLAGDWTATGWPATMEGAVRSGYLAAEAILAAAGQRAKLLRDDLPVEGWARRFARTPGAPSR
jgi:squalene-associated FAD-dependent desaturase